MRHTDEDGIEKVAGWRRSAVKQHLFSDAMDAPGHAEYPIASSTLEDGQTKNFAEPCGAEDRVRQAQTDEFPWSAICYLIIKKRFGTFRGTGFFVSPDTIVTAGHCIEGGIAGRARRMQVIPGRDGDRWPFSSYMADEFYVPQEWRSSGNVAFDYGAIKLSKPADQKIGYFSLADLADQELRDAILNTAGYPGDMAPSDHQHFNAGPCEAVYPQRLSYLLDTWTGASGSPIWVKSGEERVVVGIHNYGHCPNKASRVNARVLADIRGWAG